jgi:hypothetical protein
LHVEEQISISSSSIHDLKNNKNLDVFNKNTLTISDLRNSFAPTPIKDIIQKFISIYHLDDETNTTI